MDNKRTRFIRVRGRVIPLRERAAHGAAVGAPLGLTAAAAAWSASSKIIGKGLNPLGSLFWGYKGALVGAGIGAGAALAFNKGKKLSNDGAARAQTAFKQSAIAGALGQGFAIAAPFMGAKKGLFKNASIVSKLALVALPAYHALKAKDGDRALVLTAGATGAIGGANLGRLGSPFVRNSKRWGLR